MDQKFKKSFSSGFQIGPLKKGDEVPQPHHPKHFFLQIHSPPKKLLCIKFNHNRFDFFCHRKKWFNQYF